jgi:hypothetical protein
MRGQVKIIQKKIIAKKRRRVFLISLYSLVAIAVSVSALSYASHAKSMQIESFKVSGNSRVSSVEIEHIVREKVAGNFLGLFSKSNAFLYPKGDVLEALMAVPAIGEASVERTDAKTLAISIKERGEVARWCSGGAFDASDCYSLDENGYIFARAIATSSETSLITYRGAVEGDALGKHFLDEEGFDNLRFFMGQLDGLSVDPKEVFITDAYYMTVYLGAGGRLILNRNDDLSLVLGNIAAIISDKSVAPSLSNFLKELDYIKLDSGNKVVYKVRK